MHLSLRPHPGVGNFFLPCQGSFSAGQRRRPIFCEAWQNGDAACIGWSGLCLVVCSNSHTPRRRRFAPEAWDGGGAPSLQFRTKGAPNAQAARQRQSKINGRDAAPSGSHFCGEAALVWESYSNLQTSSRTHQRSADGASRLNLWTTRRSSLHLERRGAPNARSARQRHSKPGGRCSVGVPLLRRSRLCIQQRRRFAPEAWDGGGAPSLHLERRGRRTRNRRGSAHRHLEGDAPSAPTFALKSACPFERQDYY